MRVVLDTNVLVAAAYAEKSASRRIVEAALRGDLQVVASQAMVEEYRFILSRAVRGGRFAHELQRLIAGIVRVEASTATLRVAQDPADEKFLAAAEISAASALITSDQHLLAVAGHTPFAIVKPAEFLRRAPPALCARPRRR